MELNSLNIFLTFFGFLFGAAIGSFLNVVVLRTHKNETLEGRSYCPACKHTLNVFDLIPIFSYLFLGGKCRYCQKKISAQYPLVELTTAISFALVVYFKTTQLSLVTNSGEFFSWMFYLLFFLFFTCVLIVISVTDLKWGIIPDKIVFPAAIVTLFYLLLSGLYSVIFLQQPFFQEFFVFWLQILGAAILGGFFLLLIVVTAGRGMGGGDFKLALFIGLTLTWQQVIVGSFLAFLTGAIVSVMLLLLGKKGFKQTIAFGPFLAVGAFIAGLFGDFIFNLYLKTLGLY